MSTTKLRMTGRQQTALRHHLFPGDGKEAVALGLCGISSCENKDETNRTVMLHSLAPVHYEDCWVRTSDRVTWPTSGLLPLLGAACRHRKVILKVHSHPSGMARFTDIDDVADRKLFTSIAGWLDTDFPGVSAIMLPDGKLIARAVAADGSFGPVQTIVVAGDDIQVWHDESYTQTVPEFMMRTEQAFGRWTATLLSRLSIGIVGVSGTGSPVAEMLYRLGVGELVLIDDDVIEEKNLGRIYNSSMADAIQGAFKVHVIADAIKRNGLPTRPVPIPKDLFHPEVVRRLAQCDVIFGCMDSVDGRDLLNQLCVFYSIPYFDLGVRLDADGNGGVSHVCGSVHYLQPDGSSLLSRRVYTTEQLRAAALKRANPEQYREQLRSKYIIGAQEDRPAVISINTLTASLAVNDLLARLHPFRDDPNCAIATIRFVVSQNRLISETEGPPCPVLAKNVGRGDVTPLLNMPILSERRG